MYYITTSRPYTNDKPHLGTIMDPIIADCLNRFFKRIHDGNSYFSMGTDEHSQKISDKATELGIDTKKYVDEMHSIFAKSFDDLDIMADDFVQSSDPKHHWVANLIWDKLKKKGLIYKKNYQGLYCKGCEDFYSPSQLIDGKCPIHPHLEIVEMTEENYFFKLSSFGEPIIEYLKSVKLNDEGIRKEMLNFANELRDISISRKKATLDGETWGVSVWSDGGESKDAGDQNHVYYKNFGSKEMTELEQLRKSLIEKVQS